MTVGHNLIITIQYIKHVYDSMRDTVGQFAPSKDTPISLSPPLMQNNLRHQYRTSDPDRPDDIAGELKLGLLAASPLQDLCSHMERSCRVSHPSLPEIRKKGKYTTPCRVLVQI
jgi:hypothetical protein